MIEAVTFVVAMAKEVILSLLNYYLEIVIIRSEASTTSF